MINYANQKLSPRSFKRKLSSLKAYYKFLIREGVVIKNPTETVLTPKHRNPLPEFFSSKEMGNLFDHIKFHDNFEGIRDKTILNLFYNTGIRLSELVNMKENDVDISLKQIKVTGKRNKQRNIPISDLFLLELKQYSIAREEVQTIESDSFLFLTIKGKPVYRRLIQR